MHTHLRKKLFFSSCLSNGKLHYPALKKDSENKDQSKPHTDAYFTVCVTRIKHGVYMI